MRHEMVMLHIGSSVADGDVYSGDVSATRNLVVALRCMMMKAEKKSK